MESRSAERARKIRTVVRQLLQRGQMRNGHQAKLARHFNVSRQWVHQIVVEERSQLSD